MQVHVLYIQHSIPVDKYCTHYTIVKEYSTEMGISFFLQLPEQYRLDPPLSESHRHHKKKKKHKHKHVDKTEDSSLVNYIPPISREHSPPVDPCDFIKSEQTQNFFHPAPQHTSHTHLIHAYSAQTQHHPTAVLHSIPSVVMTGGLIPNTGVFTSTPQSVIVEGGSKLTGM